MKDNTFPTKLYNLAYRLTGCTVLAEEISIKAVNNISNSHGNTCDHEQLFLKAASEVSKLIAARHPEPIQGNISAQDKLVQVQLTLNKLPLTERLAVVLRDFFGLSYVQIGITLGIKREEVPKLLSLGRIKVLEKVKLQHDANLLGNFKRTI